MSKILPVVLVVEDEPAVRRLLMRMLTTCDLEVIAAASAEEALLIADRLPCRLSAVISDLGLPQMSGSQLLERLRSTRPGLPAILVSGQLLEEAELGELGATALLEKPFSQERLLAALRVVMEGQDIAGLVD
jgi:CheY-like chemotaxis protein